MSKKLIVVFAGILFFSSCTFASASLLINEFVSDPESGAEWIELKNTSSSEISLSSWKWTELASPGGESEHESTPKSLNGTVPAAGFFVLETNNSLNNSGDSIGLYNESGLVDRVTFGSVNGYSKELEAPQKGRSGAYINGGWQTNQTPTKGEANPSDTSGGESEGSDDGGGKEDENSSGDDPAVPLAPIKLEIYTRSVAYVGIPHQFQGRAMRGPVQVYNGRYFWNFGDGDFREVKVINTDKFTHTYFYPGEHTVVFEYYRDHFSEEPEVVLEKIIKVIEPQVSISRVGDERDFFVELTNATDYSVDISGWQLSAGIKSFTVPKNTVIGANKKMIISGRTSGFTAGDKYSLRLLTPTGETAYVYYPVPARGTPRPTSRTNNSPSVYREDSGSAPVLSYSGQIPDPETEDRPPISANLLMSRDGDGMNSSFLVPLAAMGFIGIAAFAVYFIRQGKTVSAEGDDFQILDE